MGNTIDAFEEDYEEFLFSEEKVKEALIKKYDLDLEEKGLRVVYTFGNEENKNNVYANIYRNDLMNFNLRDIGIARRILDNSDLEKIYSFKMKVQPLMIPNKEPKYFELSQEKLKEFKSKPKTSTPPMKVVR